MIAQTINNLSKAETLEFLETKLLTCQILPLIKFTYSEWIDNQSEITGNILTKFEGTVIIRSSCLNEDSKAASNAGMYLSIPDVELDEYNIIKCINSVFSSYGDIESNDQVFVQEMLNNVQLSGVAFSHDPSTGAPYYVINSESSGSTSQITSGARGEDDTFFLLHGYESSIDWQKKLIETIDKLILLYGGSPVDVEFAIKNNELYLFQVRELLCSVMPTERDKPDFALELRCIQKKLKRLNQRHPYLLGDKTLFGVMPDWNPAEIIGIKPKPLALSLYKELVTDDIWAYQRANYGYRNLVGFPLLSVLGGTPFIDVRTSFNSFVPSELEIELAEKLVNYYVDELQNSPQMHDKIEFEIVMSCYRFDLNSRLEMLPSNFSCLEKEKIKSSLISLTNNIISGNWKDDLSKISLLQSKHASIMSADLNKLDKIYWLLQDCKNLGTLPFAGLARCGFIAIQLLNSLAERGLLSSEEISQFMLSLETVSSSFIIDRIELSDNEFKEKYGHLRPGTYDITSKRYDECPEKYLCNNVQIKNEQSINFQISLNSLNSINKALAQDEIKVDAVELLNFIKDAIEAREHSKFIFSRNLSDALKTIEQLGAQLGVSRDDMAFVDVKDILKLYSTSLSAQVSIQNSIALGKSYHKTSQLVKLPMLLRSREEVLGFKVLTEEPNFITQLSTSGKVEVLTNNSKVEELEGKIVFIESADPGFDWLFNTKLSGLVTQFGGRNSHMAIRAGELGLPAVIGAGEKHFNQWKRCERLVIDCSNQKVEVFQ